VVAPLASDLAFSRRADDLALEVIDVERSLKKLIGAEPLLVE
jgi:hypothetical protein